MKIDPKSRPVQITVALMIVLPTVYLGLGYVIASQAIAAKPGCYVWEDNHPDSSDLFDVCVFTQKRLFGAKKKSPCGLPIGRPKLEFSIQSAPLSFLTHIQRF